MGRFFMSVIVLADGLRQLYVGTAGGGAGQESLLPAILRSVMLLAPD